MSKQEKNPEIQRSNEAEKTVEDFQIKFDNFLKTHPLKHVLFNGNEIEYFSSGDGPLTLLLLPGGAGIAEVNYKRIFHLEKNYRVIAPSFMYTKTMQEYTDFTEKLLAQENVNKVILLGGSGGGMLAQGLYHRMCERITAMILSNTYPPVPKWRGSYKRMLFLLKLLPPRVVKAFMLGILGKYLKPKELTDLSDSQKAELSFMYEHLKRVVKTKYSKKINLIPQYTLMTEWQSEVYRPAMYEDWHGEVLVIIGDRDKGFEYHPQMMAQFPNMSDHVIRDAGHMASIQKQEEYERLIDDFLGKFSRNSGQ